MRNISNIAAILMASAGIASADIVTETRTFNVVMPIEDPQNPPSLFLQTINDSAILSLTAVQVGLHLRGTFPDNGFASDMYVALSLDLGPSSILLNRVGTSFGDPVGFFYDGWNVTFSDDSDNGDIHVWDAGSGVLTGTYQPDGRILATDESRPAMLSLFNGHSGNGDWRLAVADLSQGGQMTLVGWSLTLIGETTIPEPSSITLLALGAGALLFKRRR